ncbi:DUF2185 domain-containing protein [Altererythrobacter sp. MF3-039]|uniref:immunity protein Imm33 domain-containing protein n=1 Tax=Altererythrobacter sp. MF3-039 TaxID=3252901 RepID=UPI00390CA88A
MKAIFRQDEGDIEFHAERMWVEVERVEDTVAIGRLVNEPHSLTDIEIEDPVTIPVSHVIAIQFADGKAPPCPDDRREYWERCLVDACVVEGRCHADYLYREEPDMTREDDTYPDSGWRIRGTSEAIEDDQSRGEDPLYIAIGKVLNADDRWIHLIDSEAGTGFQWDSQAQDYIALK